MTPQPQTRSSYPKQINTISTNKDDEVSAELDCKAFKSRILIEWTWPSTRILPSTKHQARTRRVKGVSQWSGEMVLGGREHRSI
ncbi:hypothetical protein N7490_000637 [Penicillium lividum]|nr:hypothetical protein N7490_000637 [Penicillium lividum]